MLKSLKFYRQLFSESLRQVQLAKDSAQEQHTSAHFDQTRSILSRRTRDNGLTSQEVAQLLTSLRQSPSQATRELILTSAEKLRTDLYGNQVATMVPIEMSSFCASNCQFCGWRSDNSEMPRLQISDEALAQQVDRLTPLNFSHFELVAGDDLVFIKKQLTKSLQSLRKQLNEKDPELRVSICLTPLREAHYESLKSHGLDTNLVWQETYSPELYHRFITRGPKAFGITEDFKIDRSIDGYFERIQSQERSIRQGLQAGLGAMIGLGPDLEAEILSVISHGQHLVQTFDGELLPLIFGMPTWNPITTPGTDQKKALGDAASPISADEVFELIGAIILLSMPDAYAWVFPNCRVKKETQIRTAKSSGVFSSTMVRVGPGAYLFDRQDAAPEKTATFFSRTKGLSTGSREEILKGEQFVHTYEPHENYLKAFERAGLEVVKDQQLIQQFNKIKHQGQKNVAHFSFG